MRGKLKKILCYLIISLFIMGIGGEKVFAATVNRRSGSSLSNSYNREFVQIGTQYDGRLDFRSGAANAQNGYFMFDVDGADGYCLESIQEAPSNGTTMQEITTGGLSDHDRKIAGAIIDASNKSQLIPDKTERFYVTQALLWEYVDVTYESNQGSPFTSSFKKWIHSNYPEFVSEINTAVQNVTNSYNSNSSTNKLPYTIVINGSGTLTDPTGEVHRLETEELTISTISTTNPNEPGSSPNDQFTLTCIGDCSIELPNSNINEPSQTTVTISRDTPFKLVTGAIASGYKSITLKVTSTREVNTPSVKVYANATINGLQQIAVLTSENSEYSTEAEKTFSYYKAPNEETKSTPISFRKIDAVSGERLAGAVLKIYKIENDTEKLISSVVSKATGEDAKFDNFTAGTYKMVETRAPHGYSLGTESERTVNFTVEESGNNLIVKQEGTAVQPENNIVTLVMKNKSTMFRIKKVDQNNQPVANVKVFLQEPTTYGVTAPTTELPGGANAEYQSSFFGITGEDGYVKMCVDSNGKRDKSCSNTTGNGYYSFGKDLATADGGGGYYTVYETTDDENLKFDFEAFNLAGLNDQYRFGGTVVNNPRPAAPLKVNSSWAFLRESNNEFTIFNKNVKINKTTKTFTSEYDHTEVTVDVIEITLENHRALYIGKTDITTGAEIAGAELVVTDPSISGTDSAGNPKNIVDSWTSEEGKLHKINGLEINKKYRLTEEKAPDGYYRMTSSIDFKVSSDGTVTTYDPVTEEEITNLNSDEKYKLLISNDITKTLYVSKTSFVTGEEIEGAELKICTKESYDAAKALGNGNECNSSWSWKSGDDGKDESGKIKPHKIEGMGPGTYYLIETTAPAGYIKQTKAVMFELKAGESTQKIEFKNEPTKVTIQKLDLVTKQRIAGATLQILNASDRTIAKDANGTELTWVSREDADWEIYGIPAGEYILIEKVTPTDYKEGMIINDITTNEYKFTVSDQEGDVNIKVGIEVLNAPNTGISTLNLFAIGGLLIFAGYETIRIYRKKTING